MRSRSEQAKKVARILGLKIGGTSTLLVATTGLKASTQRTLLASTRARPILTRGISYVEEAEAVSPTAHIVGISKEKNPEAISHERMTMEAS